jgi:hypothetical protein
MTEGQLALLVGFTLMLWAIIIGALLERLA